MTAVASAPRPERGARRERRSTGRDRDHGPHPSLGRRFGHRDPDPADVAAFIGDAQVLTDDVAPVDQLLGR